MQKKALTRVGENTETFSQEIRKEHTFLHRHLVGADLLDLLTWGARGTDEGLVAFEATQLAAFAATTLHLERRNTSK